MQKMPPNTTTQFTVTLATRKTAKHQRIKHIVPIDVLKEPNKGTVNYLLEFTANLTIPELSIGKNLFDFQQFRIE